MVAKGKGRAGSKPSGAAASQAESTASTAAEAAQALLESIKEIRESSDEEQVSNEQLQALRKRVAEQEEYTILLRRIKELEQEQSNLALQALRNQNDVPTLPTSRGLRFDKHTAKYRGKNLQELRQWIRSIEDDYENFPNTFTNDQKRIFYASKALKFGSQLYKH
jgi:predicted nuclease with TOPRIM domain